MTARTRTFAWIGAGLLLFLVLAYGVFRWSGADLPGFGARGGGAGAGVEATPEIAQATLEEINDFRSAAGPREMELDESELTSLLRYSAPGVLPEGVTPPDVRFVDDRILLETRVAVDEFRPLPEVERALDRILPDSVTAELTGSVMPFGERNAAIRFEGVRIAGVRLPGRLIPRVLEALGREDVVGLPPDAMVVQLPAGLSSAYILSDRLILVSSP